MTTVVAMTPTFSAKQLTAAFFFYPIRIEYPDKCGDNRRKSDPVQGIVLNSILKGIYFYLQHKSVWNESIRTHSSSVISQLTIPQLKEISSTNHEKSEVEMEVDNPRRERKRIRGSFSVGPSVTSIDILSNS